MKTSLDQTQSRYFIQKLSRQVLLPVQILILAGGAMVSQAQTPIIKANSYTSLTTGSDWSGGTAPGSANIAVWNSVAGTPVPEPLGANTNWAGILVSNPAGPVTITADGNTLTNGEVGVVGLTGIDMSSATVSLTLSNNLDLNGVQNWNLVSGQTLNIDGVLSRNEGSAVLMYFNPGTTTVFTTNGSATVNNTDTAPDAMLGGTLGNEFFATIGDTDYVAEVTSGSGLDLVPGSTISGLYTQNSASATPSDAQNETVMEMVNPESIGDRLANNRTYGALLFNALQTNTINGPSLPVAVYQGLPAWNIIIPSGRTLTINSVLCTTNDGNSPMLVNNGTFSGGTLGNFRIGSGGQQDLFIFQNDPFASLIIQPNINLTQQGAGSLLKMGVGTMQIQGAASYSGGTKIYGGTLEIDGVGSAGTGAVNVYGGIFAQSSRATNSASTTFFSGTTNDVLAWVPNSQSFDNSTITFNSGSTIQFIYSNTIVPSTTAPALMLTNVNGLTLNSPVSVQVLCGGFSAGTFPLISYAGTIGGAGASALSSLALPPHIFGYLSNDTTHSFIDLVITNVDQPLAWNAAGGNGVWDIGVTANWLDALGNTTTYQQVGSLGDNVAFNDNSPGSSPITVTLNTNVSPSSVTVNNAGKNYIISGTGSIGGLGALTMSGSGTVTLGTANSFTGGINLNGGTVIFSALGNLGAGAINFGGGALQYNGNADDISTRTVNLNAGGGTINTAGQAVNYANPIGNGSAGGLTKAGSGTLTLNGTNTYHGNTTVSQGTLALGANTFLTNSAAIIVNSGAVLDTTVSGVNLPLSSPANQTLQGVGQVNGVVTAPASTTITPASSGLTGTLTVNGGLTVAGGTLNMTLAATSNDVIAVTGAGSLTLTSGNMNINVIGSLPIGTYTVMTYSGSLSGSPGSLNLIGYNFASASEAASLVSASGKIELVVAVSAHDVLTWPGTGSSWDEVGTMDWLNGSTPWAFTNGDTVTFNDSETGGNTTVGLMASLAPSSVTVSNTAVPIYTFADGTGVGGGNIAGVGTTLVKDGTGTLIVQTANNPYTGPTTIKNGTLQIGNGGVGDIGEGNVTNNGALVFAQGDAAVHNVQGKISGTGSLTMNANGTVVLEASNSYSGPTTISTGTLQVGNGGAGSLGSTTAVTNNGTLVLDVSGNFAFPYNITGSGIFFDEGTGTASLSANLLTYQGNTYISNGVVKLGANNQLPNQMNTPGSTGDLNLDGGTASAGTLDLNGFNLTLNALSGLQNNVNGIITNSSTSATTTNILTVLNTTATTYNGQIMDHGATGARTLLFVTGGANALTLNPSNSDTFSGGIIISNGTLALGTPAGNGVVNINEDQLAPGTGPITMLGTNATLIVDGNTGSEVPTYLALTNPITIPANQVATIDGSQRGNINSTLLGSGVLNYNTTYERDGVDGNWSGFTGQIILTGSAEGGNIGFGVTNALANASVIMNTNVGMYCGTIDLVPTAGETFQIGALSGGDSSCQIESTNSGNGGGTQVNVAIGGLNLSTTYSGGFVDNNSLVKVGTGTLTLNCGGVLITNITLSGGLFPTTNIGFGTYIITYSGTTTVSNGVLALDVPVVLTNSPTVTIASPTAILDASSMGYITNLSAALPNGQTQGLVTNSTFEVISGQTLGGVGTLNGFLQADAGSIFDPGLPTGAFNVTSNATLSGTINMNLDNTNTATCSELVTPAITANGVTLVVTNLGPGLINNTTYTLFSQSVPLSSFSSITLPATDPTGTTNYTWQTNLAVNGSITLTAGGLLVQSINPNPTNIVFSISSGNLVLTWPSDHTGWTLQSETNSLAVGLKTNDWVNVANSTTTNQVTITRDPKNPTVFYRLTYTIP